MSEEARQTFCPQDASAQRLGQEREGSWEDPGRKRAREAREGRMLLTCRSPRDLAGKTVSLNLTNWISMHQCWVLSLPPPSPTLGLAMSSGPFLSLSASNLISNTDFILQETGREEGRNRCDRTRVASVGFAGKCRAIQEIKNGLLVTLSLQNKISRFFIKLWIILCEILILSIFFF